jgi:hypothetical protein
LILNPWGFNSVPVHLRLEEGCVLRLVVRKVSHRTEALRSTTLQAGIGTADTAISVSDPLNSWPARGQLRISSGAAEELVAYADIDKTASPHRFMGVTRGRGGTIPQAWPQGASIDLDPEIRLSSVGGRLLGRYWYNTIYGGAPNRL